MAMSEYIIGIELAKSLTRRVAVQRCTQTFLVEMVADETDATAKNKQSVESANLPRNQYED